MKSFNCSEGFYRLFIVFSVISGCCAFYFLLSGSIALALFMGIMVFLSVYLSYFILYWIISGFLNDQSCVQKFPAFIKNIVTEKYARHRNVFLIFILILFAITFTALFFSRVKISELKIDLEFYKNYAYKVEHRYNAEKSNFDYCMQRLGQCSKTDADSVNRLIKGYY